MMIDDGMTASGKGRRALRRSLVMDRGKNLAGNEGATRLQGLLGVAKLHRLLATTGKDTEVNGGGKLAGESLTLVTPSKRLEQMFYRGAA